MFARYFLDLLAALFFGERLLGDIFGVIQVRFYQLSMRHMNHGLSMFSTYSKQNSVSETRTRDHQTEQHTSQRLCFAVLCCALPGDSYFGLRSSTVIRVNTSATDVGLKTGWVWGWELVVNVLRHSRTVTSCLDDTLNEQNETRFYVYRALREV